MGQYKRITTIFDTITVSTLVGNKKRKVEIIEPVHYINISLIGNGLHCFIDDYKNQQDNFVAETTVPSQLGMQVICKSKRKNYKGEINYYIFRNVRKIVYGKQSKLGVWKVFFDTFLYDGSPAQYSLNINDIDSIVIRKETEDDKYNRRQEEWR